MIQLLPIIFVLAGCSQLPHRASTEQLPQQTPDEIAREAISLRSAGRWRESLALLTQANAKHPDDAALQEALKQTQILHKYEIRTLEDRLLVVEANSLKGKASLLQDLAKVDPGNYSVGSRMYFLESARKRGVSGLVECGRFHKWNNQPLAQHCLQLANELSPSTDIQLLLDEVTQKIESDQSRQVQQKRFRKKKREKKKQALRKKKIHIEQVKTNKKIEGLLTTAKDSIEDGNYLSAATTLDMIERMSPQDTRLHQLRTQLKRNIDGQVEELDKTGDRLYRDEQVDQAVAIWKSALDLDPNREDIIAKVERATKVLTRLQTLQVKPLPLKQGADSSTQSLDR